MPINVLFTHSGDLMRGSEAALLTLLCGLDRKQVSPLLFTSNEGLAKQAMENGIETTVHPMPQIMIDSGDVHFQVFGWAQTVHHMSSFIEKNKIDLVYCNGGSTCQVGYYAGRMRSKPVICHLHSPYDRRYIMFYRFHLATKVIFVSDAIRRSIVAKKEFQGDCQVVYNGVDTARFTPPAAVDKSWRTRLAIPENAVVFGQASSMISRKGIDVLLRAHRIVSAKHPSSRLVLVGDGAEQKEFMKLSEDLGVAPSVIWTGNQADTLPYYQHVFDVNVLASRNDAFPLSVLEAAACGLPNIGARVDGIPESVVEGENGFLFDSEDHEMLAGKMSLLIQDPELRTKLGRTARQVALERFSKETYCGNIQQIIVEQAKKSAMAARQ